MADGQVRKALLALALALIPVSLVVWVVLEGWPQSDDDGITLVGYWILTGALILALGGVRLALHKQASGWRIDDATKHDLNETDLVDSGTRQAITSMDHYLWSGQSDDLLATVKGSPAGTPLRRIVTSETGRPPRVMSPAWGIGSRIIGWVVALWIGVTGLQEYDIPSSFLWDVALGLTGFMVYWYQFHPYGGPLWVRPAIAAVGLALLGVVVAPLIGEVFRDAGGLLFAWGDPFLMAVAWAGLLLLLFVVFGPLLHLRSSPKDRRRDKYIMEKVDGPTFRRFTTQEIRSGIVRASVFGVLIGIVFLVGVVQQLLSGRPTPGDEVTFALRVLPVAMALAVVPPFARAAIIGGGASARLRTMRRAYMQRARTITNALRQDP